MKSPTTRGSATGEPTEVRQRSFTGKESRPDENSSSKRLLPENVKAGSKTKVSKAVSETFASIDKQMPSLTYHGFTCWMCWNTIAFSGSFWMHETANSLVTEQLVIGHLIACVATLLFFALLSKRMTNFVPKNWFTFIGACIATAGSLTIILANDATLKSMALFTFGSVLTGVGTTFLFVRAAALFSALPPRRAIFHLASCSIVASAIYFTLCSCGNTAGTVAFVLLPLASTLLYGLRTKNKFGESAVLRTEARYSSKFSIFLASVFLCSTAFELVKSSLLMTEVPRLYTNSTVFAQAVGMLVMAVIIVATLLLQDRYSYGKCYSASVFFLAVILIALGMVSSRTTAMASMTSCICNVFNLTIWAMLAYIVFQANAGAVRTFCLGNAALALGTAAGGLFSTFNLLYGFLNETNLRLFILMLGALVLVDLVFMFSEKQINELLEPIEKERLTQDVIGEQDRRPKQWVLACQAIAESCGLSKRESEVFVELARGRTAQEIADRETVSVYTIRAHTRSIYAKLDVHSKKELAQFIEDRIDSE